MRDAVIDGDLFAEVHFGMTAASKFTGHDQAAAKGGAIAVPDECEKGVCTENLIRIDQPKESPNVSAP